MASIEVLPVGLLAVEVGAAFGVGLRSWTVAMMCRTRLICRFPPRESRWRTWSPEEASIGCGAVPGREVVAVGEPGDVADLDQQPGGAGGADAVQVQQRGAGRGDEVLELLVGGLLAGVDPLEVADSSAATRRAGLADRVARADLGQQCLGLGGGEVLLRPAGDAAPAAAGAAG